MTADIRPKLLFVCHLPPPMHGAAIMGSAAVNSKRVAELFEVSVIPIRMTDRLDELRKFAARKVLYSLDLWFKVAAAIVKLRPRAVYLSVSIAGFSLIRDYITVRICKTLGCKLIFHLHTKGIKANYDRSSLYRFMYRSIFRDADVIHQSQVFYDDVSCVVPLERFHPVANAIDVGEVTTSRTDQNSPGESVPVILFLSNLLEEKGPLDLLEASDRLAKKGIKHKVVFAGGSSDERVSRTISQAQQADDKRVLLAGPLYGAAKDRIFAESDIFAFPTYYHFETQSLVVMEAMGHALAIVASSEGAIFDLLKDGAGLTCAPRDIAQLTSHLERLIEDRRLRFTLGQTARERYLRTYTLQAFEERFAGALSKIVSGGREPEAR